MMKSDKTTPGEAFQKRPAQSRKGGTGKTTETLERDAGAVDSVG